MFEKKIKETATERRKGIETSEKVSCRRKEDRCGWEREMKIDRHSRETETESERERGMGTGCIKTEKDEN